MADGSLKKIRKFDPAAEEIFVHRQLSNVKEAVTALGSSTELATHLFRECWAEGTGICLHGNPG